MVRAAHERSNTFYIGWALWIITSLWLIQNDLGVVAFVGSCLGAIWFFGLRDDKFDSEQTASAYNVFNKNGQAIAGSYTADQLESQLRGRPKESLLTGKPVAEHNVPSSKQPIVPAMSKDEKLKRRRAAAAAAERRVTT